MSNCCAPSSPVKPSGRYRRVLWIALAINAAMFALEIATGLHADSTSLLADAVDFLGDAANYGLSLFVLGLAPIWRSKAALVKAAAMATFGVFVLVRVVVQLQNGRECSIDESECESYCRYRKRPRHAWASGAGMR